MSDDADCICKGNWRSLIKEYEPHFGSRYVDEYGDAWTLAGILDGGDDYYFAMMRLGEAHLCSCVGSLESQGYTRVPSKDQA